MFLLYFEDQVELAKGIGSATGLNAAAVGRHRFPDGEIRLTLPSPLPKRVAILRSLHQPNEKLIELLLSAQTARSLGARQLTLIAPYLAYMRQDKAFNPGEAVSQSVIGNFLGTLFDGLITVDPHLHRTHRLGDAVAVRHAIALSAAPQLADQIARVHERPILVGPDAESAQWVAQAAQRHGHDHVVCSKTRHGDRDVSISLPEHDFAGRAAVLIDDVASSAQTLISAAGQLLAAGALSVDVAVTHALFAGDALERLRACGVRHIWSTDCVAHSTNAVSMADPIAQALSQLA